MVQIIPAPFCYLQLNCPDTFELKLCTNHTCMHKGYDLLIILVRPMLTEGVSLDLKWEWNIFTNVGGFHKDANQWVNTQEGMASTVVNFVWNPTSTSVIQTIFSGMGWGYTVNFQSCWVHTSETVQIGFWMPYNPHLRYHQCSLSVAPGLQETNANTLAWCACVVPSSAEPGRGGGGKVDYNDLWFVAIEISTLVKCWTHGSLRGQQKLKNSLDKYVPVVTLYDMECVCPLLSLSGWFCVRACQNWNGEWS